jgi:HEPN domain-containing protein
MKADTQIWLKYAQENYSSANILLEQGLLNNSIQNFQQSIEKYLKACFIEAGIQLERTHSIQKLLSTLENNGITIELNESETELIDSIYLPSKYPIGSALAEFEITIKDCELVKEITDKVKVQVNSILK